MNMKKLEHLFKQNKEWAQSITDEDPNFFKNLSKLQSPEYLWIGCSDSRVPSNQLLNLAPGEVFVHRNIANMVIHSDLNCLSVMQFAIEVLKVKHIIVCGHYGCGGIKASLEDVDHGLIDNWLGHIKDVHRLHATELNAITDQEEMEHRLCELNVIEQVANVCDTTIVKNAWKSGADLSVHGWVYNIKNGILKDITNTPITHG
ncbi:MAG: carbonic anhydrase [Cycloclasticus pugetii]|jgi:carbonic anhydrase|nr:carbonic anhydrase [Cycloclasticus pugetii]|tara:strand:+ start:455 stop:1063 length:609 start_codon:yes stop_codon:yes gene_type:complete